MRELRNRHMWHAIAVLVASACGGDGGSSGVVTGLPKEQKLSTLSDTELQDACRSIDEGARLVISTDSFLRVACLPFAVQAGSSETSTGIALDLNKCQSVMDTCVKELSSGAGDAGATAPTADDEDGCSDASSADVAGCDVTVGQYEVCINRVLNQINQKLAEYTCQNAEKIGSATYDSEIHPEQLPECKEIMTKCPDAEIGVPFASETAALQMSKR